MPENIAVLIPFMALLIPIVAIISSFKHKTEEMRIKAGISGDTKLLTELRELKNQIAEIRDTTTRYDMSFDSALQRIESRVSNLEGRVTTVEQGATVQRAG